MNHSKTNSILGNPTLFDSLKWYRFGFNGQEKDNEIGQGIYTAQYWEYDSRIGRRWNLDPKSLAFESSYSTNHNNPIIYSDPKGDFGWVGAIGGFAAGALWEIGSQVVTNMSKGQSFLNAMKEIDYADVVTTGLEGALVGETAGLSLLFAPVTRTSTDWKPYSDDKNERRLKVIYGPSGFHKDNSAVQTDAGAEIFSGGIPGGKVWSSDLGKSIKSMIYNTIFTESTKSTAQPTNNNNTPVPESVPFEYTPPKGDVYNTMPQDNTCEDYPRTIPLPNNETPQTPKGIPAPQERPQFRPEPPSGSGGSDSGGESSGGDDV
jgi:RHS repeat-associated protein